jgi:hypothetical protein
MRKTPFAVVSPIGRGMFGRVYYSVDANLRRRRGFEGDQRDRQAGASISTPFPMRVVSWRALILPMS